jgi:hypothetical protein
MAGWRKAMAGLAVFLGVTALALPMVVSAQTPTATPSPAAQWRAALTGANEVPPVTTTATGTFTATLDEAAGTLAWTLTVPSITNATAAHIHTGAAGVNGGIVVNLFAAPASGPTSVIPASSINVTGTARSADVIGTLAGNFAGLVTAIKGGTAYVNVHTTQNPGGEIRGQIAQGTPTATATATGTATATATATAKAATPTATAAAASPTVIAAPKSGTGFGTGNSAMLFWTLGALAVVSGGIALGAGLLPGREK